MRSVPLFPVGDGDEWASCEDGRIYASLPPGAPIGLLKARLPHVGRLKTIQKLSLLVGYDDSLPVGQLQYCKDCQQDTFDLALSVVFLDGV